MFAPPVGAFICGTKFAWSQFCSLDISVHVVRTHVNKIFVVHHFCFIFFFMSLFLIFSPIISIVGFFFCRSSQFRSGFLLSQLFGVYFFSEDPLILWIFDVLLWFFMCCGEFFLHDHRQKKLQWLALDYLNSCILQLEAGFSLQNAMKQSLSAISSDQASNFELLWQNLFQLEQKKKFDLIFFERLHQELQFVCDSSQKITDQIRKIRSRLKKELHFRRKSGQILRSLRIQSAAMLMIYIVFVFIFEKQFHVLSYPKIFFSSVLLFFLGMYMVFMIGRRLKWKT